MGNPRKPAHPQDGGRMHPGSNIVELRIPSSPEYVRVARLAVTGLASRMGFSYADVEDIKLAVSEACNNAIQHGPVQRENALDVPSVTIELTPYDDRLDICVIDEGRLPPPGLTASKKPRHSDAQELPEGGLGLLLIESLMDKVEHTTGADSNTSVRMVKYLRPRQSTTPAD